MLHGEKTILRPMEQGDLDFFCQWLSDPEITDNLGAPLIFGVSRAAEEEFYRRISAASNERHFAILAPVSPHDKSNRLIGALALTRIDWIWRNAELGIFIGEKTCWNKGYGQDAVKTLLRFAFSKMNLHRIALYVNATNLRAIRCYQKCGFVEEGVLREHRYLNGRYFDELVMGVLREPAEGGR